MKTLALRLLPYLISFAIGAVLYIAAELHIDNEGLNSLVMSMAAGLLSVPLMFICYELIKTSCEKKLQHSLREHLCYELNHYIIDVLSHIKKLLSFEDITVNNLDEYLALSKNDIRNRLKPDAELAEPFSNTKRAISALMYNGKHTDVLSDYEVHLVLNIAKQAGIIAAELSRRADREVQQELILSISMMLKLLAKWTELLEDDLTLHRDFQFIND